MPATPSRSRGTVLLLLTSALLAAGAADARPPDPLYQRLVFEHRGDRPVASVAGAERELTTRRVDYGRIGGEPVRGYLARPAERDGATPGLLVIHERWGLNEDVRAMTRRLAANGYTALAVDLYGGETADAPEQARALMEAATVREQRLRRNLRQAFMYLDVMPTTERIGSIGWCFGGGWSLRTALMFPGEMDAAVLYYGQPVTEREHLQRLSAPLLGHFGSADSSIPTARVRRFERLLTELDKPHRIHVYRGAGHAFANRSGTRYAEQPAERAWQRTIDFLARRLKQQ